MTAHTIRIGIVAGETSGDVLGAGLMRELKKRYTHISFEGVGGPLMQAEGCISLYPMERLSIIGIAELLGSLFGLIRMRRALVHHYTNNPPDVFIGIDAPAFNTGLEARLKAAGIRTMHYVGPTVWAWRRGRIKHIKRAVDHMLVLFPFEESLYREHGIPVTVVGHPLADELPENPDRAAARRGLGLSMDQVVVALLPGSRRSELRRLGDIFIKTAKWLHARNRKIVFASSLVSPLTRQMFLDNIADNVAGDVPIRITQGNSRDVMIAADVIILASGTVTLEAAFLERPMVVVYKVSLLTYVLAKMLFYIKHYAMPNNLAGHELVPELMQYNATPEKIGAATEHFLAHPEKAEAVSQELKRITAPLRQDASARAASAVAALLGARDKAAVYG